LAQVIAETLGWGIVPAALAAGVPDPAAKAAGTMPDLSFLRDFTDGDEAQMQHFIQKFMEQYPAELARLETAIQQEDREAIYQAAHGFRPQLEFGGLKKAADLAFQLEQNARMETDFEARSNLLAQLKTALSELPKAADWSV